MQSSGQEEPQHIQFAALDLAAVQSHTDANIAVATAAGASPIIVSVRPTPEPSPETVSILTADDGEHKSGDAVITLPTGMANILDQLIMKKPDAEKCFSDGAQKRDAQQRPSLRPTKPMSPGLLETVRRLAEFTLNSVGKEGLGEVKIVEDGSGATLPTINDSGVVAAMEQTREYAAQLSAFRGKAQESSTAHPTTCGTLFGRGAFTLLDSKAFRQFTFRLRTNMRMMIKTTSAPLIWNVRMTTAKDRIVNALQRSVPCSHSNFQILPLTEIQGPNKDCDCSSGNGT